MISSVLGWFGNFLGRISFLTNGANRFGSMSLGSEGPVLKLTMRPTTIDNKAPAKVYQRYESRYNMKISLKRKWIDISQTSYSIGKKLIKGNYISIIMKFFNHFKKISGALTKCTFISKINLKTLMNKTICRN